jgi:hypothetical protein
MSNLYTETNNTDAHMNNECGTIYIYIYIYMTERKNK